MADDSDEDASSDDEAVVVTSATGQVLASQPIKPVAQANAAIAMRSLVQDV